MSEFAFEVDDPVNVIRTKKTGRILSRTLEWDPDHQEMADQYEVQLEDGTVEQVFGRNLDLRNQVVEATLKHL